MIGRQALGNDGNTLPSPNLRPEFAPARLHHAETPVQSTAKASNGARSMFGPSLDLGW